MPSSGSNSSAYRRRSPLRGSWPVFAAERRPRTFDSPEASDLAGAPWSATPLNRVIDELGEVELDGLSRDQLQSLLVEMTTPLRRLEAARARVTGALHRRESSGPSHPGRADRACREFLTGELGLTPAEAKDVTGTSKRLSEAPTTSEAYNGGRLTSRHVSVIASCLAHIPMPHRRSVEEELLDLAGRVDPVELGRRARQLIAAHDVGELRTIERRRQSRRRFSYHDTPEGGLRFSGELFGIDAEQVRTAFEAFTPRPDADDRRSHDKRRADGLITLAGAALRAGEAPTRHGVRPHVLVVIDAEQLRRHTAGLPSTVRLGSGESVSFVDAHYALDDCDLTRIVLDAAGAPIEASVAVRTVPSGLWRALQARDQGCTWNGCTAPTSWCDVAHLDRPFASGGRLSPSNAALLCRRHHRRYDAGGWRAVITGDAVRYQADPGRPAVGGLIHRDRQRQRQSANGPPLDESSDDQPGNPGDQPGNVERAQPPCASPNDVSRMEPSTKAARRGESRAGPALALFP